MYVQVPSTGLLGTSNQVGFSFQIYELIRGRGKHRVNTQPSEKLVSKYYILNLIPTVFPTHFPSQQLALYLSGNPWPLQRHQEKEDHKRNRRNESAQGGHTGDKGEGDVRATDITGPDL